MSKKKKGYVEEDDFSDYDNSTIRPELCMKPENKKAEGISMNVIIVAALALLVLVVLVIIFSGKIKGYNAFDEGKHVCDSKCSDVPSNMLLLDDRYEEHCYTEIPCNDYQVSDRRKLDFFTPDNCYDKKTDDTCFIWHDANKCELNPESEGCICDEYVYSVEEYDCNCTSKIVEVCEIACNLKEGVIISELPIEYFDCDATNCLIGGESIKSNYSNIKNTTQIECKTCLRESSKTCVSSRLKTPYDYNCSVLSDQIWIGYDYCIATASFEKFSPLDPGCKKAISNFGLKEIYIEKGCREKENIIMDTSNLTLCYEALNLCCKDEGCEVTQ